MRTSRRAAVVVAAVCVAGIAVPPLAAAGGTTAGYRQTQLGAGDGASGDFFGGAVAVDGNTIVLGAQYHTVAGKSAPDRMAGGDVTPDISTGGMQGAAYVFTKPANGDWSQAKQVAELTAGDGVGNDRFGASVAISGDTIVVGAPDHVVGANESQGAAYVFTTANGHWTDATQVAELTAGDGAAGDGLGYSVAVDGGTAAAGAPYRAVGGHTNQGAAYMFTTAKGDWSDAVQDAELTAGDGAAGDEFGVSLGLAGGTVVAGAPDHGFEGETDQGAAYVFAKPTVGWVNTTQTRELTAGDGAGSDEFGQSVAVAGNTVAVGAPNHTVGGNLGQGAVRVFTATTGDWTGTVQATELTAADGATGDRLGYAVAMSGNAIVAGAPDRVVSGNSEQGAAYLFTTASGDWSAATQAAEFVASGGAAGDGLGRSVGLGAEVIAAGAPDRTVGGNSQQGAAYVFVPQSAPTLGHVTQSHKTWRLGTAKPKLNPAHHGKAGTVFSFTLNTAATVTLHFVQQVSGREVGGRCRPVTARDRHDAHCTRHVSRGTLTVQAPAGRDHVYVAGPLDRHHRLRAGRYAVTIRARNAAGASAAKTLRFTAKSA